MKFAKVAAILAACLVCTYGLTEKEDQTVTDILAILKRGTSVYPLEDLMHTLAKSMGFKLSAKKLNRFVPASKSAYATVYDMLISVDTNGKHSAEQHQKLRQLIDIIGNKVLDLNAKDVSFKTLVVQEEEDDAPESDGPEVITSSTSSQTSNSTSSQVSNSTSTSSI
ncbi:hypothetical protein H4R20_007168 [Coemansia guatemalensis]|uniref:Uncharacterized protein n=1 Tax=Coemansia guatemalensis TaxID=2761395 RepID=A0A9W8HLF4_9FUNG|nr:hypothetical protein H4R20_007168 [Coemansia guatemalensis]